MATADDLRRDLSLHNDVLFSLLTMCQLVIDVSGELAARRRDSFDNYVPIRTFLRIVAAFEETR